MIVAVFATTALIAGCVTAEQIGGAIDRIASALRLSTHSTAVQVGAETQLQAEILDQEGVAMPGAIVWHSTAPAVAEVEQDGTVRGLAAGDASVVASAGDLSDTASVQVTEDAPPPPPPPPPPSSCTGTLPWACEPTGMTLVTDYGFDQGLEGAGWNFDGNAGGHTIVQDATAPGSPSAVMQLNYPIGFTAGVSPGVSYPPQQEFAAQRNRQELYVGMYWKANPGWQSIGIHKVWFGWTLGSSGSQNTFLLTWLTPSGSTQGQMRFNYGFGDYLDWNQPNLPVIQDGRWYKVETYYRLASSAGANDGVLRIWIDGQLVSEHTNVRTHVGSIFLWYIDATYGGTAGTKTQNDWFRIDHTRISVR